MKTTIAWIAITMFLGVARSPSADIELSETLQLPVAHSIGWVNGRARGSKDTGWDGVLDEIKWGTPSPKQILQRNWAWEVTDDQWHQAVAEKGDGRTEEVKLDLWVPEGTKVVKGIVVMSGHGSGTNLFEKEPVAPQMKAIARELDLALYKFVGNPMQRGFWPKSLLYEQLKRFGERAGHPELEHAPLFLYGHSNGTGFSAIFPATEGKRVWGWVSMRPGTTFQVYQPGAAKVPGLVIFGEKDEFFGRPSREENLAVVPLLRKKHDALWNIVVEPKTGHWPTDKTWPLVFSFLRHTFEARVPKDCDPRHGPVALNEIDLKTGWLGQNWDVAEGGYQTLAVAPYADFTGDKSAASWLINADYAADWQALQRDGEIKR